MFLLAALGALALVAIACYGIVALIIIIAKGME